MNLGQAKKAVKKFLPVATIATGATALGVMAPEESEAGVKDVPKVLKGLAYEARKYDSFEDFKKAFLGQIKHGKYYHVTQDANFKIDPQRGPRDMSSMASGRETPGKLMITSDLPNWADYYSGSRPYAAIINMDEVPKDAYKQVNRGFGNEFYVDDPTKAKVETIIPIKTAKKRDRYYSSKLPGSETELRSFYDKAKLGVSAVGATAMLSKDALAAKHKQMAEEQALQDAYSPVDMVIAGATGGATMGLRAISALADPVINYAIDRMLGD